MSLSSKTSKVTALSLGQTFNTIVGLIAGMVMARVLSQTELATYRQTLLAYQVAMPLLSLGITHGIYYFLPTEKKRGRGIVVDALVMMLVMGSLYALFIALGGNHVLAKRFSNPAIVNTLVYLVPLPLVMLPAGLLASVMVVQQQIKRLTIYNILTNLVLGAGIIGACLYWKKPEAMVIAQVAIGVAIGMIGIRLMLRVAPRDDWRPSWQGMKTLLFFSMPLVTASALGSIFQQLDKIIVSSMCDPASFAVYSNGAIEIPLVGIITGSIAAVIQPDLRRMVAGGDKRAALALFSQAADKSALILIPVMMFLMVSAEPFILTLFSSKYAGSVLPFRLYLLILPIRIAQYGSLQMALGLNKTIMHRSAVSLVANVVLSIILVKWFGFIGAIIGTIIALYAVNSVWNMATISWAVGCRWQEVLPFQNVLRLTWVAALPGIPLLIIKPFLDPVLPPVAMLALNALVYVIALAAVVWVFRIQALQEEMRRIYSRIRNMLLKHS